MKIGYDAKRAAHNFTGLGNYSRYIIDGVIVNDNNEIVLYNPKRSAEKEYKVLLENPKVSEVLPSNWFKRAFASFWRSFFLSRELRKDKIDIFHGLSNELPRMIRRRGVLSVVSIHDIIFRRLPHCYRFIDRVIYDYKFRYACKIADRVIAISECTKRDIIEYYNIDPDKITVIYQGCSSIFKQEYSSQFKEEVTKRYALPKKFILNVGTLEERKNLALIVRSLHNLPEDVHIVAVGRRTKYSDAVAEYARINNLSSRVHMLHSVRYADLPVIYSLAEIFAYPSRYEGFGIPIIEAISSGLAVIAATGSCLEEAGGDGAIYVNPDSVEEFTQAAKTLLDSPDKRMMLVQKGREYIKKFDDKVIANQIIETYKKELAKRGK